MEKIVSFISKYEYLQIYSNLINYFMTSDLSNFLYFFKIVQIINYPTAFEHSIFTFETFYKLINILLHKLDYSFREFYELTELFSNFNLGFSEKIQSQVYKLILKTYLWDSKNFYILRQFLLVIKKFDYPAQETLFCFIKYNLKSNLYQTNPNLFWFYCFRIEKCLNFDSNSQYNIAKFLSYNLKVRYDIDFMSEFERKVLMIVKKLNVSRI